jgi:hypothetical protein
MMNSVKSTINVCIFVFTARGDTAVIRNKKKNERAKQRIEDGHEHCANFAEEWLAVYRQLQTNDVVRFIGASPNRVPSVVLYSDNQLRDLKAFCFNRSAGSVLSFDKTFNLGEIYVTPSVYKNMALQQRRTSDYPVFLGPVFVNGHSDIETFGVFFSQLAIRLIDCDQSELTLGSDDELAMRKAMSTFFPRAATVVCSRHLQENVARKLDSLIGAQSLTRRQLHDAICGSTGIMSCNDAISFETAVEKVRTAELAQGPPEFQAYFYRRLLPLLRANVAIKMNKWTNNNCESIN